MEERKLSYHTELLVQQFKQPVSKVRVDGHITCGVYRAPAGPNEHFLPMAKSTPALS